MVVSLGVSSFADAKSLVAKGINIGFKRVKTDESVERRRSDREQLEKLARKNQCKSQPRENLGCAGNEFGLLSEN